MAIDNISEWSYSRAIAVWYVYESTGFHVGNIGEPVTSYDSIYKRVSEGFLYRPTKGTPGPRDRQVESME